MLSHFGRRVEDNIGFPKMYGKQTSLTMKLTAMVFLVWVAQAQGQTTTAPETSTTGPTTTGSTGTSTTGPTTTGSAGTSTTGPTTTGSTGTTSAVASSSTITTGVPTSTTTTTRVPTISTTTTTSPPVPDCTAIETPAKLNIAGARPCIATQLNDQTIQFKSPKFPKDYPNSVECKAETSSDGPRFLEITPKLFTVHKSDKLIIKGPFGYKRRIKDADLLTTIKLPSANAKFEFTSSDSINAKGFNVEIRSRTNKCQRICSLQAGASGYLKNGAYGADTYCEWWMEAPTGCFIRMNFEKFDVGPASSGGAWSCKGDFVGVDRNGDPGYDRPDSKTYCGSDVPKTIRSVDNKINVLFNGRDGGFNGFKIKYTVVC